MIASTRFVVIGAGGLGGPIAYALAAAGAGAITVADPDRVELSNLQRQVQFSGSDIGSPKVFALAGELCRRGYPAARVRAIEGAFAPGSAADILDGAGVVIDGSDDLATKFAANDAALARGIPVIVAGITRHAGHVLCARAGDGGCYRCLFEGPPDGDEPPTCADAGVLGAVCAVIGGEAARAALALAAGNDACGITIYDDVTAPAPPRRHRISPRPGCPACALAPHRGHQRWAS